MGPLRRLALRRLAPLRAAPLALLLAAAACSADDGEGGSEGSTGGFTSASVASTSTGDGSTSTGDVSGEGSTSGGSSGGDTTSGDATSSSTGDALTTTTTTGDNLDDCPRVRVAVAPGDVLNVRPDPSTANPPLGTLASGAIVDVVDLVSGELLDGNDQWYEITSPGLDGFVWSGLVECTLDEPPEPPDGFYLPLVCGTTAKITQGNFGDFSHQGTSAYAFDFSLGVGTPLVAIADGTVHYVYDKTKPGDPCYNGGDASCINKANLVTLLHGDGTTSLYAHLSEVQVGLGDFVPRGEAVGLSGSSGYSTGRHAHVARQEKCEWGTCQSIAVSFVDVPGDGVPKTGQSVTSMNCP